MYHLKTSAYSSHSRLIESFPPTGQGAQVLDVGGGEGYLARMLAEKGYSLTCICQPGTVQSDLSEIAEVVEVDLNRELPNLHNAFAYVLCGDVLEHLVDPLATLTWIQRHLDHNGKLIASLPNSGNIYFRLNVLVGRFPDHDSGLFDRTHLHYYAWSNWKALLAKTGFRVTHVTPTPIPFGLAWPRLAESGIVHSLELLNYSLAEVWITLWAYQFVIVAEREQ